MKIKYWPFTMIMILSTATAHAVDLKIVCKSLEENLIPSYRIQFQQLLQDHRSTTLENSKAKRIEQVLGKFVRDEGRKVRKYLTSKGIVSRIKNYTDTLETLRTDAAKAHFKKTVGRPLYIDYLEAMSAYVSPLENPFWKSGNDWGSYHVLQVPLTNSHLPKEILDRQGTFTIPSGALSIRPEIPLGELLAINAPGAESFKMNFYGQIEGVLAPRVPNLVTANVLFYTGQFDIVANRTLKSALDSFGERSPKSPNWPKFLTEHLKKTGMLKDFQTCQSKKILKKDPMIADNLIKSGGAGTRGTGTGENSGGAGTSE